MRKGNADDYCPDCDTGLWADGFCPSCGDYPNGRSEEQ